MMSIILYVTNTQADGLTNLFKEIKEKEKIDDLTIEYKKFAEWLRIEYVLMVCFSVRSL